MEFEDENSMMIKNKKIKIVIFIVIIMVLFVGFILFYFLGLEILEGIVDIDEINIISKVIVRVDSLYVREGDSICNG